MAFDPFKDFEQRGYLRNKYGFKDADDIKEMEHEIFRAGLDDALEYIAKQESITYADFLQVHRILFEDFYPWAGIDRATVAPECAVSKAGIFFILPSEIERAINEGLRLGQSKEIMTKRPGEVMGYFAYAHPFLDGNGRTMLIIHSELCRRAGFAIEWHRTNKTDYLLALSKEIELPGNGYLDNYLSRFIVSSTTSANLSDVISSLKGLDGSGEENTVAGEYSQEHVMQKYREFELKRRQVS